MNVRQLLGWFAEKLPSCKKLPVEFHDCVPYVFACLEDRNADVRKKAHEAVLPFMIHTGYEVMARHASKAKVILHYCLFMCALVLSKSFLGNAFSLVQVCMLLLELSDSELALFGQIQMVVVSIQLYKNTNTCQKPIMFYSDTNKESSD